MHSIVCAEPGLLELQRRELPVRNSGEVLLKLRAVGVCGTDYHAVRGKQPFFQYPRILGHEIAAEIKDIDDHNAGFHLGDLVTIIPYLSCSSCMACRRGKPNACVHLQVLGVHIDGGMQEYLTVPMDRVISAGGLTTDETAMVEPLAIGLHAVRRAQLRPDEHVLVIGAGPIGLGVMKFARLAGAQVIAFDLHEERLEFARSWAGVENTVIAANDPTNILRELTDGEMPETVIDATGYAPSMMRTIDYASHGGKIVFVSLVQANITFSDPTFHKKELSLLGSRAATKEEFSDVMQFIRDGQIEITPYITHRAEFHQVPEQFQQWIKPESGVIKALIEF